MIQHGSGRAYIIARLRRDGFTHLIEAIETNKVRPYAVAVELGWTKRPRNLGTGSDNAKKRRAWTFRKLDVRALVG